MEQVPCANWQAIHFPAPGLDESAGFFLSVLAHVSFPPSSCHRDLCAGPRFSATSAVSDSPFSFGLSMVCSIVSRPPLCLHLIVLSGAGSSLKLRPIHVRIGAGHVEYRPHPLDAISYAAFVGGPTGKGPSRIVVVLGRQFDATSITVLTISRPPGFVVERPNRNSETQKF